MLLRFSVKNHLSLRDRQELSLAADALKGHDDSVIRVENFNRGILPVAAIYGANASGKSNILAALAFLVRSIQNSYTKWKADGPIRVQPFLLDEGKKLEPSAFELDFMLQGTRYSYGCAINVQEILEEWLYAFPNGRKQLWFEREGTAISFGKKLSGENHRIQSMTRKNSLFLSAAAQHNHEMLLPIFAWLTSSFQFCGTGRTVFDPDLGSKFNNDPGFKAVATRWLSAADLGIVGVDVEEIKIPAEIERALTGLVEVIVKQVGPEAPDIKLPDKRAISLRHKAKDASSVPISMTDESAGTVAFLSLLSPVLSTISNGGVLCVDDLDSSLHPLLALEIVRIFVDPKRNHRHAQLIFNTHNTNLLDSSLLRRDEIWLTEKDQEGASHLYSLSEFKPRKRENLKRGYLQGRFGAIPFVQSLATDGIAE